MTTNPVLEATYICHSGDDLLVVNAARVSFAKRSKWQQDVEHDYLPEDDSFEITRGPKYLSDRDAKLIRYLAEHQHWTPFAHPQATIHIKAPIFVARQCFKHKVGFVENEVSRRYVDDAPELYMPEVWRGRSKNAKQGSAGEIIMKEARWKEHPSYFVEQFYMEALRVYERALEAGVAPEQARMVLPQSMMTEWFWTGSLAAWARFYKQRTDPNAQAEIGELAQRCAEIIKPLYPVSWKVLTK